MTAFLMARQKFWFFLKDFLSDMSNIFVVIAEKCHRILHLWVSKSHVFDSMKNTLEIFDYSEYSEVEILLRLKWKGEKP